MYMLSIVRVSSQVHIANNILLSRSIILLEFKLLHALVMLFLITSSVRKGIDVIVTVHAVTMALMDYACLQRMDSNKKVHV